MCFARPSTPPGGGPGSRVSNGRKKRLSIKKIFHLRRKNAVASGKPAVVATPPIALGNLVVSGSSAAVQSSPAPVAAPASTATPGPAATPTAIGTPSAGAPGPIVVPTSTGTPSTGTPVTGTVVAGPSTVAIVPSPSPSSAPTLPWDVALTKLSPEDQLLINPAGLDKLDVLDKVLEATTKQRDICREKQWKYTWRGETIVLRDVADKLFVWVDKFKSIGDVVVSFDPTHAALPWAGFRFLLQIVLDDNQKMGAMLVTLEVIANLMGRCAIYETLYLGSGTRSSVKFEEAIVELYARILIFLVRARKYYAKNTGVRIATSTFDTETNDLISDIEKQEALVLKTTDLAEAEYKRSADQIFGNQISDAAGALDKRIIGKSDELKKMLEQFQLPISRMESDLKIIRDGLEDTERMKVFKWLSQVEYAKHHLNACEGRVAGTGEWLLRKKDFLEWQKSSASTILWLRGIPGAGKTKLTSRVIDKFIEQQYNNHGEALAYFYCRRDETGSTDPEAVMSAIVKQLSCLRPGLPLQKEITELYQARKMTGFSSKSLLFQESLRLIISLVSKYPQTTIIIDALDECDPEKRKKFLSSLKTIVQTSTSLVKIFVSSRNDDDIVLRLDKVPNFWIEATDNEGDIERFVQEEVLRCIDEGDLLRGDVTAELRDKVITSITKGSQGMFLWVNLQIKEICSMDMVSDVEARLGKLPETLENTYIDIYERILSQKGLSPMLALKALKWVMCSRRPFSPDELAAIITLGFTNQDKLNAGTLLKLCRNLLTLDSQLNIVRFSHLSVREFLEKNHFNVVDAHSMASMFCLTYAMDPSKLRTVRATGPDSLLWEPTTIEYPILYWPAHIQECLGQQESTELLIKFLRTSLSDWYDTVKRIITADRVRYMEHWEDMKFKPLLPLQVASVFGFGQDIKGLWESEVCDINAKNKNGDTLLYLASLNGHLWIVRTLIEKGADIHIQCGFHGNALYAASQAGHEKIIELLLEKGADVNAQGGERANALQMAASNPGNEKVVKLLLEKGADVNAQGGHYGNALCAAVTQTDNEKVVAMLLDAGADASAPGGFYGNALQAAATQAGGEKVIKILLEKGVDVNVSYGLAGNALYTASEAKNENVVKLLLEKGADVNAKGGNYGSALVVASGKGGNEKVIKLLLEWGADVNSTASRYGNALYLATQTKDEKLVEILLDAGADINTEGGHYGNTLQAAVLQTGNEKVVAMLLEKGADVNAQGGYYGNPLQAAVTIAENEKVVKLLLEKGANVNAQGGIYRNILEAAATCVGNESVVDMLLQKGAIVNSQNINDGGALRAAAARSGNEKTIMLLLEAGADINAGRGERGTALSVAAGLRENEKAVELLLECGADVNIQCGLWGNALGSAVNRAGNDKIVEMLLEKGANVNAQFASYGSPIQLAATRRDESLVKMLLKLGADVNLQCGNFGNALQAAAAQSKNEKIIELLLKSGADVNAQGGEYGNALQAAATIVGNENIVEMLLKKGVDVNAQGGYYGNALQAAASRSLNENIIKLLLEAGADINAQGGEYGNALYAAAGQEDNEKVVEILLESGADINAQGGEYGNALQAACQAREEMTVKLLLEKGADVNAQCGPYGNALQTAVMQDENEKVVKLLLEHGADINAEGGEYGDALRAAKAQGDNKIVDLLLKAGAQ